MANSSGNSMATPSIYSEALKKENVNKQVLKIWRPSVGVTVTLQTFRREKMAQAVAPGGSVVG